MRRSQSEESVSTVNNPYEMMRKQRLALDPWQDDLEAEAEAVNGKENGNGEATEDDEEKTRAYAEADYIYNSVRRRPFPQATDPGFQRLQRSSSNVIRRSIMVKSPNNRVVHPQMHHHHPQVVYVAPGVGHMPPAAPTTSPDKWATTVKVETNHKSQRSRRSRGSAASVTSSNSEDTSDKESSQSEDETGSKSLSDSEPEVMNEAEKAERLRERNIKRMRDKVTSIKQAAMPKTNTKAAKDEVAVSEQYDGDVSALESPKKVNRVAQNMANSVRGSLRKKSAPGFLSPTASGSSDEQSKLMQLYNRRKRQQESQLRSEFSPNDIMMNGSVGGKGFIVKDVNAEDLKPSKSNCVILFLAHMI